LALDLTLAGGKPILAVLDDLKARKFAQDSVGLPLTGTLGILLRIHRLRRTDRTLGDDLARLEHGGMRFTPDLKRELLARAERDC
jgi:predicted nucleic acid-binding protein